MHSASLDLRLFVSAALALIFTCDAAVRAQAEVDAPRLLALPELHVPPEVSTPVSGEVQATITVQADGGATLDECEASDALRQLVERAIAEARFEPARRNGEAVAARVRITLRLAAPPSAAEPTPPPAATTALPPARAAPTAPEPLSYGAVGRTQRPQPGARRLELAEMRSLPGAFGDPFRAVDALPGVVPILSGVPYFFIRGSPPAGTLYAYDDIPIPSLYHLAVGPAAIHPRMVGPVTLYSGVAPARYGRVIGGVIAGEGPPKPDGQTHFETELRLLDVSGYLQTDLPLGTLTAAARYGYPALLLSLFSSEVSLAYWDYQLRYDLQLSDRDHLQIVALGSHDALTITDEPEEALAVTYHRVESRLIHRLGRGELGGAVLFGWEASSLGSEFQLAATRVGPRLWLEQPFGEHNRVRVSADMQAIDGNLTALGRRSDLTNEAHEQGLVGDIKARSVWGAQLELTLRPWSLLELRFGARGDAWLQRGGFEAVLDPRLRLILHASETLDFHIAGGVVHQPAVFFLPLPGISDLPNDSGLQSAIQSELGVGWDTPLQLRAELQLFMHRYENLMFTDTLFLRSELRDACNQEALLHIDCRGIQAPTRIDGYAYGAELFVRRPFTERISGFLSYTLAFSNVDKVLGQTYTPTWDVRHIASLVLRWQIIGGFSAGIRAFVRSGKVNGLFAFSPTQQLYREEVRAPGFARLDAELAYAWRTGWGQMRLALEWFNVTLAREPRIADCSTVSGHCTVDYEPAIFFPNLSIRGEH